MNKFYFFGGLNDLNVGYSDKCVVVHEAKKSC